MPGSAAKLQKPNVAGKFAKEAPQPQIAMGATITGPPHAMELKGLWGL